jgi:hypothetical protein
MRSNLNTIFTVALMTAILGGCGEPHREEGQLYTKAAKNGLRTFNAKQSQASEAEIFWNDCGREVTCIFLYKGNNPVLIENVVVELVRAQVKIGSPGVKLAVYSNAHNEPKVLFREITIK